MEIYTAIGLYFGVTTPGLRRSSAAVCVIEPVLALKRLNDSADLARYALSFSISSLGKRLETDSMKGSILPMPQFRAT